MQRLGHAPASAWLAGSSRITENSSPPVRATVSERRTRPEQVAATCLQHQVANVVSQRVIHLLEVVQIDQQQSGLRTGSAGALDGAGQAVLEEPAIGQAGQLVVQREMPVVFDLFLQEQQNHAHSHQILGQVPNLALNMDARREGIHDRRQTNTAAQAKKPAIVINAPVVARRYI